MAVALDTLIEPLKRAVNPPGRNFFPNCDDGEWLGRLADAFWAGRLAGFFSGYVEVENNVQPVDEAGDDLDRGVLEVVVQYAAARALQAEITQMLTAKRYKAGPVEAETERSAQVLAQRLKEITEGLKAIKDDLLTTSRSTSVAFIDALAVSNNRFLYGYGYDTVSGWVN